MSENIKQEDLEEKVSTSETEETESNETVEQDPLKKELERVQKTGRTELEKAQYSLRKNADRLKELGGDPTDVLGIKQHEAEPEEDDKPVTLGMLKKMQQESASKTALQLAEDIKDETERELARWHLQNTIKSTGNPSKDLELAMNQVNAVKNRQILEEVQRKGKSKSHSSSSSASAKYEVEQELSKDELAFMKPPFNLTKAQIIKARG